MSLSNRAAKKMSAWLSWCRQHGWKEEYMPGLADLWLKHHDEETGELADFLRNNAAAITGEGK